MIFVIEHKYKIHVGNDHAQYNYFMKLEIESSNIKSYDHHIVLHIFEIKVRRRDLQLWMYHILRDTHLHTYMYVVYMYVCMAEGVVSTRR